MDELTRRLLSDARRLFGDERAEAIQVILEQTARDLDVLNGYSLDPGDAP